jgi:hypothetical protein
LPPRCRRRHWHCAAAAAATAVTIIFIIIAIAFIIAVSAAVAAATVGWLLIVVFPPAFAISAGVFVTTTAAAAAAAITAATAAAATQALAISLVYQILCRPYFHRDVFETCSHILTITNHKSQIYNCESQTQMSFGYAPISQLQKKCTTAILFHNIRFPDLGKLPAE